MRTISTSFGVHLLSSVLVPVCGEDSGEVLWCLSGEVGWGIFLVSGFFTVVKAESLTTYNRLKSIDNKSGTSFALIRVTYIS